MNSIEKLNKKYEKLETENEETLLKKSLLKKARGFIVEEIVEESVKSDDNNSLTLIKRKTTTKEIPPDMSAIKYLIEMQNLNTDNKYSQMTDEELRQEKINLLKLLKEEEEEENANY